MPTWLRRLRRVGRGEWLDVVRAQAALLRAQRRLRDEPIGSLAIREEFAAELSTGDADRAAALAHAVHRAARYGLFRPYCLVRAMALRELLLADGIRGASIRIGVRRLHGEFQAHAWIRWGAHVLGDEPRHVAQFTEVDDLGVMRTA